LDGGRFAAQFGSDFGSRIFGRHTFQRRNVFVCPTLSYLGHVIGSLDQIMDLDPQNLDDLKMFQEKIGMAGERYALKSEDGPPRLFDNPKISAERSLLTRLLARCTVRRLPRFG
jgi:hypothetical protein